MPRTSHLKYDRSGKVPTILVPQPSDDPNDPLVCRGTIYLERKGQLISVALELAFMEARPHPGHSVLRDCALHDAQLHHGCQYRHYRRL